MGTIAYEVYNGLYLNITNRCPCACTFCLRDGAEGLNPGENLWLEHEPTQAEILEALNRFKLSRYEEAVFCGYGEPCERLDMLLQTAEYIKEESGLPVRLNTNGLGDLINKKATAPLLIGHVDHVSISLNAADKESYNAICRPSFGADAYDAMIKFALSVKEAGIKVNFSVVDILQAEELRKCQELSASLGIPLRVRSVIYSK